MTIAGWLAVAGAEINARFAARRPRRAGMALLGRRLVALSAVAVKLLREGRAREVEKGGAVLSSGSEGGR